MPQRDLCAPRVCVPGKPENWPAAQLLNPPATKSGSLNALNGCVSFSGAGSFALRSFDPAPVNNLSWTVVDKDGDQHIVGDRPIDVDPRSFVKGMTLPFAFNAKQSVP